MITGKQVMTGNNVSHSNRKTRRTFEANVQYTSVYSEILGKSIPLRVSTAGLRTLDHKGGLDAYLLATAPSKLDAKLRPYKAAITKKQGGKKPVTKKTVRAPKAKKSDAEKAGAKKSKSK